MNWKSTAAASGVMLIGTWLASYAPVGNARQTQSLAPSVARTETAAVEIQREASRLHERLQSVTAYKQPGRNPFRFNVHAAPPPRRGEPMISVEDLPPPAVAVQPTFRLSLSGIAEDTVGDRLVRTAIVSSPENVYLVTEGQAIGDRFKVLEINADSIELIRLEDGSTVRLTLNR